MQQQRQHYIQNLGKYRTDAAQKYRDAFTRIADKHDENFDKAITAGDLVMRKPINFRNKLWPKWDGPFVVVDYTDQNTYQLGSANGYVIRRLVNGELSCLTPARLQATCLRSSLRSLRFARL